MGFEKVTTSLLDMDGIEKYLTAKDFLKGDDHIVGEKLGLLTSAGDDDDEKEKRVALAVSADNRETVQNALTLNGQPITNFVQKAEGDKLILNTEQVKTTYNNEIAALRDELYQLRNELAQDGYTMKYKPYQGYYDTFRSREPIHEADVFVTIAYDTPNTDQNYARSNIRVADEDFDKFTVGDHILIYAGTDSIDQSSRENAGTSKMVTITAMSDDHQTITFSPQTSFEIKKGDSIYRSRGSIINGQYVFGNLVDVQPGTKEYVSCVTDDAYSKEFKITKPNTGYATTFHIPSDIQGNYLSKLMIRVKKYGDPGNLKAYIIKKEDMEKWEDPITASETQKDILVAESKPLAVDSSLGKHTVEFTFYDPTVNLDDTLNYNEDVSTGNVTKGMKSNPNNYPLLSDKDGDNDNNEKVFYCLIVVATGSVDENNFYYITGIGDYNDRNSGGVNANDTNGVQTNNVMYEYTNNGGVDGAFSVTDSVMNWDLYYSLTFVEAIWNDFTPYDNGIYSAHFSTSEDNMVTGARLVMRVAREGIYTAADSGNLTDGASINVYGSNSDDSIKGFLNSEGRYVVIGTTPRKITAASSSTNTFNINKGVYIEPNDIVYPVNYSVAIKCRTKKLNKSTCRYDYSDYVRFEMPFTKVYEDMFKQSENLSDRLVFETDFINGEMLSQYNDFEIEIFWERSCSTSNTKMIGKIHDLVISLDKKLYVDDTSSSDDDTGKTEEPDDKKDQDADTDKCDHEIASNEDIESLF